MNNEERKLIVFEKDCFDKTPSGQKHFIKYNEDEKCATFYLPVVAPRYLKEYLDKNGYEVGYEIEDNVDLNEFEDRIYTFVRDGDSYNVVKGIELIRKRILLADTGMNLNLDLPKFNYEITSNGFIISGISDGESTRSYCFVADEDELEPELKKVMLPVVEVMPGFLTVNSSPFIPTISYKKKRKAKKSTNYKNCK